MLRKLIGKNLDAFTTPCARFLHAHKITPNMLTFGGLFLNVLACILYAEGYIVLGGIVILIAGLGDMLDGAVARTAQIVSKFGAFTDSVVDRYSDFIIFGGILTYYAANESVKGTLLVLIIICGAFLVSYIRARAELVIPRCDVGFMERPERIILLAVGSIFGFFTLTLWLLACTTHITALQRIYYTYRMSKKQST
jgi:CDP-diacylglycerol---glycerol-3-phosphate 3-phosphatidyltransferase